MPACTEALHVPAPPFAVQARNFPTCSNSQDPGFNDGLPNSGVDFVHRLLLTDMSQGGQSMDPFRGAFGAGVVAADLDGNETIDLFFPQEDGLNGLFWGFGDGSFEAAPANHPLRQGDPEAAQMYAISADYDGDGLLDLLISGTSSLQLWRNLGEREFQEQATSLGLSPPSRYPGGMAMGDWDGDGDLDLFLGNYGEPETGEGANERGPAVRPSRMWRNDGDQGFTDRSADLPQVPGQWGACLQGAFRDLDNDGDLDLIQVNDFGPWKGMTRLLENLGPGDSGSWQWQDRMEASGIGSLEFPMGSAATDFDGDGRTDLWFSDIGGNRVFRGTSSWRWADVGSSWLSGIEHLPSDVSWSVVDLDLDGDSRRDLFINYGPYLPDAPEDPTEPWADQQQDRLLHNQGGSAAELRFVQLTDAFPGPQRGNARGTAIADLNGDGVPDLVTGNIDSAPALLLGRCTTAQRITVELRQPAHANHFAIGARVEVEAAGLVQQGEFSAGGRGSFSGSQPQLQFGLGTAEQVDRITVIWPDGTRESAEHLCPHCALIISRQ